MLQSLGSLGIAKILLQVVILCLITYEAINAGKFLSVNKGVKNRFWLIYMYVLSFFVVALWAFLMICDKNVDRYILLVLAYMMFYGIPREVKSKSIATATAV